MVSPIWQCVIILLLLLLLFFGNLYFDFYIQSRFSFVMKNGVLLESGILIFMESGFLFYIHHNSKKKKKSTNFKIIIIR